MAMSSAARKALFRLSMDSSRSRSLSLSYFGSARPYCGCIIDDEAGRSLSLEESAYIGKDTFKRFKEMELEEAVRTFEQLKAENRISELEKSVGKPLTKKIEREATRRSVIRSLCKLNEAKEKAEKEKAEKIHPKAGFFRTTPMSHTQTTSGGTSSSLHHVQIFQSKDNPFDNLYDIEDETSTSNAYATTHNTPTHQEPPSGSRGRPSKRAKTSINLDELAIIMQKVLQHLTKTEGPSIDECHEKLKVIGLSPVDPLFLTAFNIFGQSSKMREAWMGLPSDPEVLKAWIKLTGETFGISLTRKKFGIFT